LTPRLQNASWTKEALEPILSAVAAANGIGFGKLAAPLRAALAGRTCDTKRLRHDACHRSGRDDCAA
jgi:hypothetical protein